MKKVFASVKIAGMAMILLFSACKKTDPLIDNPAVDPSEAETGRNSHNHGGYGNTIFYALADGIQLDKYKTSRPYDRLGTATISGLQTGETILAMDFRPATGQLYGLGSSSRLYVINVTTGVARMIGAGAFTTALTGDIAAFDFNPTVDRIRIVTSSGQNLRINPENAAVAAVDGSINGAAGAVVAAVAYTNNSAGQTTTTLYDVDTTSNSLYIQNPPNAGTLSLVGSLNLNVGSGGFDISPDNDAFGIFNVDNRSTLVSINLSTGKARVIARYSSGLSYRGFAIPTDPVAYAVDDANRLIIFNPEDGSSRGHHGFGNRYGNDDIDTIIKPITGLLEGAVIVGIDFRPLNGQLYALGNNSTIYTINTASGAATVAGTLSTPLAGTGFGFDFNPLVDRIRIVSSTGQNLRFNPNDGTTLVDGSLNPGTPTVSAVAYSNNFAGTTSTTLYGIDANSNKLYTINPPNAGTLVFQANLFWANPGAANGFDIGGTSGDAYMLYKSYYSTKLYSVNVTTGAVRSVGSFRSATINGFALGLGF